MSAKNVKGDLFRLLNEEMISLDTVAGLAGDRDLTGEEAERFEEYRKLRGKDVFSDILFVLTHQYYPRELARRLWDEILEHKLNVSSELSRNVGIAVATLDYLSNIKSQFLHPTLISERQMAEIAEVAVTDGLTQLFDYTTFQNKLHIEIKRYKRHGTEVSLIMADIDDFKAVNDHYGHQAGDEVLAEISKLITKTTRDLDINARYGGEEFGIILPQTAATEARSIAERLRRRVARRFRKKYGVTISLGVATCPAVAKTAATLLRKADEALYESKKNGKDRVTVA